MCYYIISSALPHHRDTNYEILKVNETDETKFLEMNGDRIIAKRNDMAEAIINFEQAKGDSDCS